MNEKIKAALQTLKKLQEQGFTFPCPRCGRYTMNKRATLNALSRHADVYICEGCGQDEALRDMAGKVLPLKNWSFASIIKEENEDE